MNYMELLIKRGMGKLVKRVANINNISELNKCLKSLGISEVNRIIIIKEVFDYNLHVEYKDIISSTGMCGYWAIVYKKLYDMLGYRSNLIEICSDGGRFHHLYTRVYASKNIVVDISRSVVETGFNDSTDYMQYWCSKVFSLHKSAFPRFSDDIGDSYKMFTLYSSIYVNEKIMDELYKYTDSVCLGNIAELSLKSLETLCDELTYKSMLGYSTLEERKKLATKLYKEHKPIRE